VREDIVNRELSLAVAAHLLEYPHPRVADQARAAAEWLEVQIPEAAELARRFADEVEPLPAGALEEAYTAAFDFASTQTIYAGEHLFGPSEARASFLARLKVMQRDHGLSPSAELPDHVSELLRLAAAMPPGDERDELLRDAALPTLRAALPPLEQAHHPFATALTAVIAVVQHFCGVTAAPQPAASQSRPRPLPVLDPSQGEDDELFSPSPEAAP
jgi:nitrate reductase molybdenum cofactor assembly chaperone